METLAVRHGTVIDGTGAAPIVDGTVVIDSDGAITRVGPDAAVSPPRSVETIDASGGFVIPGLLDANVHLVAARTPDTLLEFEGRYHELALEAAEILLKYGITTVFDTWGPARPTMQARDLINAGHAPGARIYCAGNIVGLGGPLSDDFFPVGTVLAAETCERINAVWEEGTGPRLATMTVEEIAEVVARYVEETGVDFIKYAATDHGAGGKYLLFSETQQAAIVEVARRYGKAVQAHTTTVESLRIEAELGADVLQHGDLTRDQPIGDALLDYVVDHRLPVASLIVTEDHLRWAEATVPGEMTEMRRIGDANQRHLIERGARLLLTTDGFAYGPRIKNHRGFRTGTLSDDVPDLSVQLGRSHAYWIKGALERGMSALEALRSATLHTAEAYGVADLVGSLEPGKAADLVILNADPLQSWEAYGDVATVIKDGKVVDREALARNLQLATDPGLVRAS